MYDGENRLVSATTAGVAGTLTYDPVGRLWQVVKGATNTRFLADGDAVIGEYDSAGNLTNRYVHGSNTAADDPLVWYVGATLTTKRFLHADHLGSIVAVTSGASAPTINAYDEYGVPKTGNLGRLQYTGQAWLGELDLYYYKARMYSPVLGRFLQIDPIGYDDQINLYAYVEDDPINGTDATGTEAASQTCAMGACGSGTFSLSLGDVTDFVTDFIPIVGDVKSLKAAVEDPTPLNIAVAGIGLIPGEGDVAAKAIKGLANPFKHATTKEAIRAMEKKGFVKKFESEGKAAFVNPRSGRSFHVDTGRRMPPKRPEPPHIDVNRRSNLTKPNPLNKRKFPLKEED